VDIHLGTYGCHAKELLQYLQSIKPRILILNGDIIDIWNFNKNIFSRAFRSYKKYLENGSAGDESILHPRQSR
jgi:UDP-2,3-diacylglucosamine pyrophosphatase LpxH